MIKPLTIILIPQGCGISLCKCILPISHIVDQYKEIWENNKVGKTRDLFKKIRDIKRTFEAKMGTINDRNGMDLREAEDTGKW